MTVKTEPKYLGDGIKWEQEDNYSRAKVTVASGNSVSVLEVVGRITKSTPTTGTADAGNTGNGTCGSVTAGKKAKIGTYTLTCITAAANGGAFKVVDPEGFALPDASVAVAYANEHLNLTIADGSTDFAVGDKFTIAVAAGSGKVVPLATTAVDGSQVAAGIMVADVDATSADKAGVMIERDALVASGNLVWPAEISAGDKATAVAELAASGIKAVTEA